MKKILFIDSGSGGVNLLAHCVKLNTAGNFLYYADMDSCPYGDKTKKQIIDRVCEILYTVNKFFHYEIVVFACNTLTTSAIEFVRKKYSNITFIGTEPAMKPAFKEFEKEDVLVMATKRTLLNLDCQGLTVKDLPILIDKYLLNLEVLREYLKKELKSYKEKKAVVLGCTHYLAVKDLIQEVLPNSKIFDSNDGVAKRLKSFVGEGDNIVQFMSSGNGDVSIISRFYQNLVNIF